MRRRFLQVNVLCRSIHAAIASLRVSLAIYVTFAKWFGARSVFENDAAIVCTLEAVYLALLLLNVISGTCVCVLCGALESRNNRVKSGKSRRCVQRAFTSEMLILSCGNYPRALKAFWQRHYFKAKRKEKEVGCAAVLSTKLAGELLKE